MKRLPILLLALGLCLPGYSATYYVNALTGSDSNAGTETAPFRSFWKLSSIPLSAGDTVKFACGTTYSGYFDISASGTSAAPITVTSYGSGDAPQFSNAGGWYAIQLSGSYIVLSGVEVLDTYESGIQIAGTGCTVQNCEITDTGYGINILGANAKIYANHIHDLHIILNTATPTDDDYGAVGVNIQAGGGDIAWNTITGCIDDSSDFGVDGGAFEIYGDVSNVTIHHNWCDSNDGVFEIGGGTVANIKLYYNVCAYNGQLGGIHLQGTYAATISGICFDNNTVVDTAANGHTALLWFNGTTSQSQFVMRNNVFHYQGYTGLCTSGSTFVHQYNLYYSPTSVPLGFTLGTGESSANPVFVNFNSWNYQLQSTSPAKNTGTSLGYSTDFLGNAMVGTPDRGAYEYQ